MKVVAFNGSPRVGGNTECLLKRVFVELEAAGLETELVQVGGHLLAGCKACYHCFQTKAGRCVQEEDPLNDWVEKMREADGILLGSPTYFADVTPEMKALLDRAGFVCRAAGGLLRRKVGAAVVAVRRAGEIHALGTMTHFLLSHEIIVPGSSYWNVGIGREPGEVESDEEGMRTMRVLGENMAWLLGRVRS
jgi:multimeric flavodoxin WrbA